jgi:AraC-like DNA-binding protein
MPGVPALTPVRLSERLARTSEGTIMSGDTLSDLLRTVRLRGAVFYYIEGSSPWLAEAPPSATIIPGIMPGADHLIPFHGIAEGSCWAGVSGESPIRLDTGDVVLFPQGDAHVMASAPGLRGPAQNKAFYHAPRPVQLPYVLDMHMPDVTTAKLEGGGRERATIVCGFLGLDARPFNPLLAALPRVLHLPHRVTGDDAVLTSFLRTAVAESNQKRPGGEAVLERLSEMLFVDALRRYVDALPVEHTGWLAGMRDPIVGRALSILHQRPSHAWTLEELSGEAGMSRSSLHDRFVHFIGQAPMQYLTCWRMQLAAGRLRDGDAKVMEIALDVGYESEAAFSRAFKRIVGASPGAWRREKRPEPERLAAPRTAL